MSGSVDSGCLVLEPGVSLGLDVANLNMDFCLDSSVFSESEFLSGGFESNDDSHGFSVDSVLGSSNKGGCFSLEPSLKLKLKVIEFQFPFESDSGAVLVPCIL